MPEIRLYRHKQIFKYQQERLLWVDINSNKIAQIPSRSLFLQTLIIGSEHLPLRRITRRTGRTGAPTLRRLSSRLLLRESVPGLDIYCPSLRRNRLRWLNGRHAAVGEMRGWDWRAVLDRAHGGAGPVGASRAGA